MGIESRVGGEARRKDVIQKRHRGRGRVAQRAMFGAGSKMVGFLSLGHLDVAQLRVGVSMSLVPKGGGSVNAPGRDGGKRGLDYYCRKVAEGASVHSIYK